MPKPAQLEQIQNRLNQFHANSLHQSSLTLFEVLGYQPKAVAEDAPQSLSEFCTNLTDTEKLRNNPIAESVQTIQLLFQLQDSDFKHFASVSERPDLDLYQSYLFIGVRLEDKTYTRTQLNQLTRDVNKLFAMPVMLVFSYGTHVSLAIIHRRLHKRDDSLTVLEKVTLIKDINCPKPHRANVEILYDLSLHNLTVNSFEQLHQAWQKVLDTKELNKKFYRELSNWYAYALNHIQFPDEAPEMKDTDFRNSTNLIRLITRVIFIWFIKEKNLVPYDLFDERKLENWIVDFKKADSHNYYNTVLQNLFFGTLNQNIHERKFAKEGKFREQQKEYGVNNLFRCKHLWKLDSEDEIIKIFKPVPFLNGGLFDCLDYENEAKKKVYVDGFSRNEKKRAKVPDHLFFSPEFEADLNSFYDPKAKKAKKYKISGLINILNRYKFTVTENTPLDQEIALDPELLGRVFENLLASYNPETQTTARKQTGSFYTPREIVDYMVGESLLQYLLTYLQQPDTRTEIGKTQTSMFANEDLTGQATLQISHTPQIDHELLETQLRQLINYENDQAHPFTPNQVKLLIKALDKCKILDPACGSGAFPMGVLQRMVFVLTKLDPDNEQWKNRQIEKVNKAIKNIEQIEDIDNRDKILKDLEQSKADIETAFDNNELDYGRKLYLIENCIYGVDIQPIAVQISKLRFFISLVVHQNQQSQADQNYGIRALPNLETKFVAANTLISLQPDQQLTLESAKLRELNKAYKKLRSEHFSTKTRTKKIKIQKQDKALRQQIKIELENLGFPADAAQKVADWQPYNQNKAANWFDAKYMMNVEKGFDIVIGNPPYVSANNMKLEDRKFLSNLKYYKHLTGKWDLYIVFVEKSLKLLSENASFIFILPYGFLNQPFAKSLRNHVLKNKSIESILDLHNIKVFESATVPACIPHITNLSKKGDITINKLIDKKVEKVYSIPQKLYEKTPDNMFRTENLTITFPVSNKIKHDKIMLGDLYYISTGAEIHGKETRLQDGTLISGRSKFEILSDTYKDGYEKYIEGSAIEKSKNGRYSIPKPIKYIDFSRPDLMRSPKFKELFESEKIIIRGSSGLLRILAIYDNNRIHTSHKCTLVVDKNNLPKTHSSYLKSKAPNILFCLSILNSKLIDFYYENTYGGFIDVYPNNLKKLPFAMPIKSIEDIICSLVETILQKKSEGLPTQSEKSEIDLRVYKLYGLTYDEVCIVEPGFGMSREAYESYGG